MLGPKSLNFKKKHRVSLSRLLEVRCLLPVNGGYGVKSMRKGRLTRLQLLALTKFLRRQLKKRDRFWFTVFPSIMVTRKGLGARMGKGKGILDDFISQVRKGRLLFELGGFFLTPVKIRGIVKACRFKLPLPAKLIKRKL